jgi:hypothetical protein
VQMPELALLISLVILSIARETPRTILFERSITSDSRCDRASARRVRKQAWWCNQLALVCILGSGAQMTNAAGPDTPALGFPVSAASSLASGWAAFLTELSSINCCSGTTCSAAGIRSNHRKI